MSARRTLVAVLLAAGLVAVAGVVAVMRPFAPALLTIGAHIEGGRMIVEGHTTLPIGSRIAVTATQWDKYLFALNRGSDPAADPSFKYKQVTYLVVDGPTFGATFDISSWPAGDIGAGASFVVDDSQPAEVVQRFGPTGEGLSGPGVINDPSDGGRYVEVSAHVQTR